MQAPVGPVVPTPEQMGKIRSELDIVHGNIAVMSEMLTEMTPGQEEAGDLQLLQVCYFTCYYVLNFGKIVRKGLR